MSSPYSRHYTIVGTLEQMSAADFQFFSFQRIVRYWVCDYLCEWRCGDKNVTTSLCFSFVILVRYYMIASKVIGYYIRHSSMVKKYSSKVRRAEVGLNCQIIKSSLIQGWGCNVDPGFADLPFTLIVIIGFAARGRESHDGSNRISILV